MLGNKQRIKKPMLFGENLQEIQALFEERNLSPPFRQAKSIFRHYKGNENSLFFFFRDKDSCTQWHIDGSGEDEYDMLISSYPNPTEILIPRDKKARQFVSDNLALLTCNRTQPLVDELIKDGSFELFSPNPGEIWYIPPKTIHRTNPKAYGKAHLCLRIWNP